jgi:hypothetical protein
MLVDHVKKTPSSGIVVWRPWLTPQPIWAGTDHQLRSGERRKFQA